jgi:hypothetical protein
MLDDEDEFLSKDGTTKRSRTGQIDSMSLPLPFPYLPLKPIILK